MVTRVFLLDDHELVRRGIRGVVEAEEDLEVVGEAGTIADGLDRIAATSPDVALLDLRFPDGDGIQVCREVRSRHPAVACIVLTAFTDDDAVHAAIVAGAAGYLLKQIGGADLVAAIRKVAAGRFLLDPTITARILERIRTKAAGDERLPLTEQERVILDHLAEGLTNREIGERMFLAEKTVKNLVSKVLSKLRMSRRSEAAAYAARLGERRDRER